MLLQFVPKVPNDNKSKLVQIMAWQRTDSKPLPEPMLAKIPDAIWSTNVGESKR